MPDLPETLTADTPEAVLAAARAAGRTHEADELLQQAAARFPDDAAILAAWAELALERQDWRAALPRFEALRRRFPDRPRFHAGTACALRQLRRHDEADAVIGEGLARLPGDDELMAGRAMNAVRREAWPEAEARWREALARHPASAQAAIGLAEALRRQDRGTEAEMLLRDAVSRLPENAALADAFAADATRRADWPEAARRWRNVADRFPRRGQAHRQLGIALKQSGRAAEAEQALEAGMAQAPDDLKLALEHAWCAHAREDWPEARRRWQALEARFPGVLEVKEGLTQARLGGGETLPAEAAAEAAAEDGPAALLRQFESLGETCEFGLVQRHFGLEPISLFRWVSIRMESLITALDARLADIGSPGHTLLRVAPNGEYFLGDRRYRFGMHTFVRQETVERDRFFGQQCRRLRFLGRKLIEDLEAGERIFVHFRDGPTNPKQLRRLHAAMRRYGRATLLYVRRSDPAHPAGTVEMVGPGLLQGYIERFGKVPPSGWDIAYASWLAICRAALARRDGGRDAVAREIGVTETAQEVAMGGETAASLIEAAARESEARDWPALLATARRLCTDFAGEPAGPRCEAEALVGMGKLAEAEAALASGIALFPRDAKLALAHAELAERSSDRNAAIERWQAMRERFPGQPKAALGLARAYRTMGRLAEADRALSEARERFGGNFAVLTAWADVARDQHDWRRALERLEVLRQHFPNHPGSYVGAAQALRQLRRSDEAEAITVAGLKRQPGNIELMAAHATNAQHREDWPEAERRWREVLARHPKNAAGHIGLAETLRRQNRPDDAEAALRDGMRALPANPWLVERFAMAATQRGDWKAAVERWGAVVQRQPLRGRGHHELGKALKQADRAADAEAVLALGMGLVPDYSPLAIEHALCAQARQDWPEARRRWLLLAERFPASLEVKEGLVQAQLGSGETGALPATPEPAAFLEAANPDSPASILRQFESLGENCEFGLVQRQYGLEPISLFRWVSISIDSLIFAIEDGLRGLGDPAHTFLQVPSNNEYFVSDTKYRFGMHTFVKQGTIPKDRFLEQQCRRLRFLGRKLLEDIESGERIFVHFREAESRSEQRARLHRALRRFGKVTLLHVQRSDIEHSPGTVVREGEGLLIGYIDRFGKVPPAGWDIAFETWVTICREALLARKADAGSKLSEVAA